MFIQVEEFEEETDDVFYIAATDSEGDTELEEEDFSLDELQELDSKYVTDPALTKFPLGCKIWYNARTSRVSTNSLRAKSATIVGVYLHLEKLQRVYKLKSDTATTQCDVFLYEDRLVYGMNCPVTVTDAITSDVCDGVIVCPRLHRCDDGEQQVVSSYDVQISQGSDITVEFGVAADRIKYRFEKPTSNNTCVESKIKGEGEKVSSVVKEVKAKEEEKADEQVKEAKEHPKCHFVSTKSNDDADLTLKPSAMQPDTSTAKSAQTTSGAVPKVGDDKIDADDYWSW